MGFYERALWPILRRIDPETSHSITIAGLGMVQRLPLALRFLHTIFAFEDKRLETHWHGLSFRNPVGLAAGVDKNGQLTRLFAALGLGHVEIGTVTPRPQAGNPKPRVFRVPQRRALVNRLGFPGLGMERVATSLRNAGPPSVPVGINIGRNAATPNEDAVSDYVSCFEALYDRGDYFTVNVSSPNTEGLTELQAYPALAGLLRPIVDKRSELSRDRTDPKPILVKVSPDLAKGELEALVETVLEAGVDGIVAVNTSTDPVLRDDATRGLAGGLSGEPLRQRALETVSRVRGLVPPDFFIIGAGGVFNAQDAWAFLHAGANLVQVYTGLVYGGPGAVGSMNKELLGILEGEGYPSVEQAAGVGRV